MESPVGQGIKQCPVGCHTTDCPGVTACSGKFRETGHTAKFEDGEYRKEPTTGRGRSYRGKLGADILRLAWEKEYNTESPGRQVIPWRAPQGAQVNRV